MSYIDRDEYEERYGDHVGYCRVHHITVLDSCQLCEDSILDSDTIEVDEDTVDEESTNDHDPIATVLNVDYLH